MLDSVLDVFSGTLPTNKGFSEGVNEASETKEIRNSEGVEYSEADLERIETAADIMGEIFTDEVISNWENLSVEERTAYLNEYYAQAGQVLGMTKTQVFFKVVLFQVIKNITPPMSNEVITLVKDTSLVRVIGVAEIIMSAERFTKAGIIWPLFSTGLYFLLFNGILTILLGKLEKKMNYYHN